VRLEGENSDSMEKINECDLACVEMMSEELECS
jgi:hypothetical protein